ncbi:MAG TPA: hypothetical protein VH816_12375 [Gaiellaceae bacterium]|jgi:hypothetical protein
MLVDANILLFATDTSVASDAELAALAVERGLTVCSADADFARFHEIEWENPVSPR